MQPTLSLGRAAPSACAGVLTDIHYSSAWRATDGSKPRRGEGMMGELVLILIPYKISGTPVRQWIKFPLHLISIPLQTINA